MIQILTQARLIFWDFDGVIKESIDIKTKAFIELFASYDKTIKERIRNHHLANGGMPRLLKISNYLEWTGQAVSDTNVKYFCDKFSKIVSKAVIDAPWVPGVEQYLRNNIYSQKFILISATPQKEMEDIIFSIGLKNHFMQVFGYPNRKPDVIKKILSSCNIKNSQCLMIGDALSDLEAAQQNNVPFLLRLHIDNQHLFRDYDGVFIKNFLET